jgi:hypothetical protein
VTTVEAPRYVAFAGPMGTSAARWGMELEPIEDRQTRAQMWIEVDLAGIMRAIPESMLKSRIQHVSDREMAAGWRRDRQAVRLVLLASCCMSSGLRSAALTVSARPGGASDHRRSALAHVVATDCTRDVDVSRDRLGSVWDVRGRCRRLLRPRARSIPRPRDAINDSGV